MLKDLGHSNEFIEKVCYLIKNHDVHAVIKKTLELKVLQDADYIADTGLIGFARVLAGAGCSENQ